MLSFAFIGRDVQRLAAVIGGVGFGTFIDELGKFITSDNDYFFKPTPFLLYTGFCILFVVLKCVEPLFTPSRFSKAENLANALNLLAVYSTAGLTKESRLLLIELLENSEQDHPIVPHLKQYMHRPVSASGISMSREHHYLRFRNWISELYARLVGNKYAMRCINGFFIVQCASQMLDLGYLLLDGTYYREMNEDGTAPASSTDLPSATYQTDQNAVNHAADLDEGDKGFLPHFLAMQHPL